MDIRLVEEDIKKILSHKRYMHSLGVMEKAEELAKIYNIDVQQAKLAGIAHDIAKEISDEEKLKYIKENNIKVDEIEKQHLGLLHGKIGSDICIKKYGFTRQMANAIKHHTTAASNMSILEKIIYIADKIEKNRTYSEVEDLRRLANKNLDKAMLYIINEVIIKNIEKNKIIHPNSIIARNELLSEE